jgi:hypothetical protein
MSEEKSERNPEPKHAPRPADPTQESGPEENPSPPAGPAPPGQRPQALPEGEDGHWDRPDD